jgi:Lar family restriction alleviation protein
MESITLKQCPFCGGNAELAVGAPGCVYIRCEACGAASDDGSRSRVVAAWNRRMPHLGQMLDRVEAAIRGAMHREDDTDPTSPARYAVAAIEAMLSEPIQPKAMEEV